MITRMTDDFDPECECQSCTTGACTPPPCPPFQTVELTVDGVCDCRDFLWPGNPECPVHAELVLEAIEGWNAAVQTFEAAWDVRQDEADYANRSDTFKQGWNTAARIAVNVTAHLRGEEPGVARVSG